MKSSLQKIIGLGVLSVLCVPSLSKAQGAATFSGGSCVSQGDWVQGAIGQAEIIVNAIETLRNDPNCTALVQTLDNSAQLKTLSTPENGQYSGISGIYSELQSIGTYLNPKMTSINSGTSGQGDALSQEKFKDIVNYMVFRKSLDAITDIHVQKQYDSLNPSQKNTVDITSQRLKSFLDKSTRVANVAVATTKSILAAMPQNELCFNARPNEAGLIFSSLVSSAAALASGGQITNVGELVSSLVQFDRNMHFAKLLKGVELEKYRVSMSCLVESTQEAYCSLQDAQDALDFNRGATKTSVLKSPLENPSSDIENSMQGLMVLLRDVPVITNWLQRILFGIDPKLKVEAEMKNNNWDSILTFVKATNSLSGTFVDLKKNYFDSTGGADIQTKASAISKLIDELVSTMAGNSFGSNNTINFFTSALSRERMAFFLMDQELPADFNVTMNSFDTIFLKWTNERSHGLAQPDQLVETIGERLNILIEKASVLSSSYFSQRMIVDAHNLIVEGMNGPNISPYKALFHVRSYSEHLIRKLETGLKDPRVANNPANADAYRAMIPLLKDTIMRLNKITSAMAEIAEAQASADSGSTQIFARKSMDVIYEFANMLTSRDSFLSNRVANAVRMDITDTLWRQNRISAEQDALMKSMGKDIVTRLSQFFTKDPILQRLDVAQAAPIHNANLAAVEGLFLRSYWEQITELNCKLYGGSMCAAQIAVPDKGPVESMMDTAKGILTFGAARALFRMTSGPTDDSPALYNQRARLCVQTLGFPSHFERFKFLCNGATIVSEFSDQDDSLGLNLSYDDAYNKMKTIKAKSGPGSISESRGAGVCALRSYIRKNTVYRMYKELSDAAQ